MKKRYRAIVIGGYYPLEVTVEAVKWHVAAARAVKLWRKRFPQDKTETIKITLIKSDINENRTQRDS